MTGRSILKHNGIKPCKRSLLYIVNRVTADDTQHFVHIPNLLKKLAGHGWAVDLVSERGGHGIVEVGGMPVTYLSREGRWTRIPRLVRKLLSARWDGNRLVFVRISRSSAFISAVLGRVLGWQTLFWVSGTVQDFNVRQRGWRGHLENFSLGILLRLVDRLVTGPEAMKLYYSSYFRIPEKKIIVLYNDIEIPEQAASWAEARRSSISERVLMVHRLSPVRETMKWFPSILSVLSARRAMGKDVQLDVVGDGAELPALEAAARGSAEWVRFHGAVANNALNEFYGPADLFLMPSAREGFPRVCLEAMSRGLPLIATDAGGTRDIFGPLQQKFVLPIHDPALFASTVRQLLDDPELRKRLSEENLRQVHRFSTEAVARMYHERLGSLLGWK